MGQSSAQRPVLNMIIYQEDKQTFLRHVDGNEIEKVIEEAWLHKRQNRVQANEVTSWRNSFVYMANVLRDDEFPADLGISIESHIPLSEKRIDFIISGQDTNNNDNAIIIELKQWERAKRTELDGIVTANYGGGENRTTHPSCQAYGYASLLTSFSAEVEDTNIRLRPCAYLHNCNDGTDLRDPFYSYYLEKAPLFLRPDVQQLKEFIKGFVIRGDASKIMYRIDSGRIRPTKTLADAVIGLLNGNDEFILVDDQKVVFETAKHLAKKRSTFKQVFIVEGGPGTGKSVVAVRLLAELTASQLMVQYVSKNSAPRNVYASKLTGHRRRAEIAHMFKGSGVYHNAPSDAFDCLIVDEAHRLNAKSGMFKKGENQVKEIINASRCAVFFVDEDQKVDLKDIGSKGEIRKWAEVFKAEVSEMELASQFRCNGSNGYLAWVDHTLQIKETANPDLHGIEYDFRVFDDPSELRSAIVEKNDKNRARIVAGYCWPWTSKTNPTAYDIEFSKFNFRMRWNLTDDGSMWILAPNSINEIGCIHTSQGLEVDYIGVIIGGDLDVDDQGNVVTFVEHRASEDRTVWGWKALAEIDPVGTRTKLDTIIKNTYRTLMTRGMKGCFVYSTSEKVRHHLRKASGK